MSEKPKKAIFDEASADSNCYEPPALYGENMDKLTAQGYRNMKWWEFEKHFLLGGGTFMINEKTNDIREICHETGKIMTPRRGLSTKPKP